jgi:uncharacterized membrane protein
MKISITFFLTLFVLFSSCNPQGENPLATNSSVVKLENDTLHIIKEFRGLLINKKDEKQFISCDNIEMIHLLEKNDQTDTILKNILPNALDGESVFLEMQAEIKPSSDKKYTDILSIKKFIKVEQKSYMNTCIPYDFWCKGNEPFWQLQISEKENLIDFYDPMQQKTTHFPYSKQEIKDGIVQYNSKDEKLKNNILIRIKKEECSDGMSEKKYNYSVQVVLNGSNYKGCALKYEEQ